jgi:hypothetical protein
MSTTKYIDGNELTCTANIPDWISGCTHAAREDDLFKRFRKSSIFMEVVEGTPKSAGYYNLEKLKMNSDFIASLSKLESSESVGLPLNIIDFSINKINYSLNPTTIRYANNCCNYINLFGRSIFDNFIYEIGGGYGGECKVMNDFYSSLKEGNKIANYNVFDLKSSHALIQKYLLIFGYRVNFLDLHVMPAIESKSLVISNGAISEMRGDLLDAYIDLVVKPAAHGYFITNFESHSKPYGGMTTDQFISRLKDVGKFDVKELSAKKYLSYFDYQAGTRLIVFGAKIDNSNQLKSTQIMKMMALEKLLNLTNRIQINLMKQLTS